MTSKVLILSGDGINCERESARAFEEAGGQVNQVHINTLLEKPVLLLQHQIFCLPGGFSFGDELRSGKILAEKMRSNLSNSFENFTKNGGLTLGICNGFQVLIQLGVFSGIKIKRNTTLAINDHQQFLDKWLTVEITEDAKNSIWFKDMSGTLMLPMRHKEGRLVASNFEEKPRIPVKYVEPVNGSFLKAAALLDSTGQILGIMPHPEAATYSFLNPMAISEELKEQNALNLRKIFLNAVKGAKL